MKKWILAISSFALAGVIISAEVKNSIEAVSANGSSSECLNVKGNTESKIYHMPGSPNYDQIKNPVKFCTEQEAKGAGYSHAKNNSNEGAGTSESKESNSKGEGSTEEKAEEKATWPTIQEGLSQGSRVNESITTDKYLIQLTAVPNQSKKGNAATLSKKEKRNLITEQETDTINQEELSVNSSEFAPTGPNNSDPLNSGGMYSADQGMLLDNQENNGTNNSQ